jgi:hypothetical protein
MSTVHRRSRAVETLRRSAHSVYIPEVTVLPVSAAVVLGLLHALLAGQRKLLSIARHSPTLMQLPERPDEGESSSI